MRKKYLPILFLFTFFLTLLFSLGGLFSRASLGEPSGKEGLERPRFEFALIGDLPYNAEQEVQFARLMEEMNEARLAFVVHDGDLKSGSSLCSDALFLQRRELFESSRHPFIFIFGDNEWTDCHRASNGGYDPLERLATLRALFTEGNESLGRRTLLLERQSDDPRHVPFRENVRWRYGEVLFVGLNVPGSNNNFGRTPEADAEYVERNAANLAWLRESFARAVQNQDRGILIVIQANPRFDLPPTDSRRTGYNDFLAALETETLAFRKPVVLVHGDSHTFRIDKPMIGTTSRRRIERFTRVETFGSPDVHWLRAAVDPNDPELFRFQPEIVEENVVH